MKVPEPTYVYKAEFIKTKDGDTFILLLDMGMKGYRKETIRLYAFDTPEKHPRKKGRTTASLVQEKIAAESAEQFTINALACAKEIRVKTYKDVQTFNRYVAEIWYLDPQYVEWKYLAKELEKHGHSKKTFFKAWGY